MLTSFSFTVISSDLAHVVKYLVLLYFYLNSILLEWTIARQTSICHSSDVIARELVELALKNFQF